MIGAASVSPDDAASNLSKWAQSLGLHDWAVWLSDPSADRKVIIWTIGVAALYISIVWGVIPLIRKLRATDDAPPAAVLEPPPKRPLTMRQIFDSDFPGTGKIFMSSVFASADGSKKDFAFTEHLNVQTNSYFLSLYFDRMDNILEVSKLVASKIPDIIRQLGQMSFEIVTPGDTRTVSNDTAMFSNSIYIYFCQDMNLDMQYFVTKCFSSYGYSVTIRSTAYQTLHWNEFERWPVGTGPTGAAGAQLPKIDGPVSVNIKNDIGTRPFWLDGPVSFDSANAPSTSPNVQSVQQPTNPPAAAPPSPGPPK